ncbi:hypothetical protein A4A49_56790, partial [Nicotiana attenuata]
VMKWVVEVSNVASKEHGRAIRRWNVNDHYAEFYCTLKYNEHGRYISFIAKNVPIVRNPQRWSSYNVVIRTGRWPSEGTKSSPIKSNNSKVIIPRGSELSDKDVLRRCIVGKVLTPMKETPTLNDIRRWACNTWKSTFGVNVYKMNDYQFLFELQRR